MQLLIVLLAFFGPLGGVGIVSGILERRQWLIWLGSSLIIIGLVCAYIMDSEIIWNPGK